MFRVYIGFKKGENIPYAVKLISKAVAEDEKLYKKEIQALIKLSGTQKKEIIILVFPLIRLIISLKGSVRKCITKRSVSVIFFQ